MDLGEGRGDEVLFFFRFKSPFYSVHFQHVSRHMNCGDRPFKLYEIIITDMEIIGLLTTV